MEKVSPATEGGGWEKRFSRRQGGLTCSHRKKRKNKTKRMNFFPRWGPDSKMNWRKNLGGWVAA